jgi:hypothetical protein
MHRRSLAAQYIVPVHDHSTLPRIPIFHTSGTRTRLRDGPRQTA